MKYRQYRQVFDELWEALPAEQRSKCASCSETTAHIVLKSMANSGLSKQCACTLLAEKLTKPIGTIKTRVLRYEKSPKKHEKKKDKNANYCIYLISESPSCNSHYIKIGRTQNLESRLVQLQTGNYRKLYGFVLEYCDTEKESKEAEHYIHRILMNYRRHKSEWFHINLTIAYNETKSYSFIELRNKLNGTIEL